MNDQPITRVKYTIGLAAIVLSGALFSTTALAMDLKPSEIRGDVKKTPVSVLQNRYFTKTFRPEVGVAAGSFVNEAYTNTLTLGFRGALFFNEWIGAEVQSVQTSVTDSDDRRALNELKYRKLDSSDIVSPDPQINRIKSVTDVNAIIAPFYGKLNLIDKIIIYSDLYFTGGIAQVDTDQGNLNSLTWGVGQRFYWKKSLSFRIDMKDRIYTEKRNDEDYTKHSYSVDVGMSYFFF